MNHIVCDMNIMNGFQLIVINNNLFLSVYSKWQVNLITYFYICLCAGIRLIKLFWTIRTFGS